MKVTSGTDTGWIPADAPWCCLSNDYTLHTVTNSAGTTVWSGKVNGVLTAQGGGLQNNCLYGGYATLSAVATACGGCP